MNSYYGYVHDGCPKPDAILQGYFPNTKNGVMLEIGAFDPVEISNSYHFEQVGWDTYCFEPNPDKNDKFKSTRKNGVFNYALADYNRDDVDFEVVTTSGWTAGWSSLKIDDSIKFGVNPHDYAKTIKVKVRTLDEVLATDLKHLTSIDILSIDVEGGEYDVLKGFSTIDKYKPKVIFIENHRWQTLEETPTHKFLVEHGYKLDKSYTYDLFYIFPSGFKPIKSRKIE